MSLISSRRAFLCGVAAAVASVGCGGKTEEHAPGASTQGAGANGAGANGAGAKGAARVVSLSPSTTETMFAIEAGGMLVGRSRFCDFPAEAKGIPAVGGFSDPNVEAILALAPSLVIGARGPAGPALAEKLTAHGIATYFPETESFAQILEMVSGLGERLDRGAAARAVRERIEGAAKQVEAAVKARPAPSAVMLFDTGPIVVAGPGGFPDEMMRLAHAKNLIVAGGAYPTIGMEHLVALDPEILLDGASAGIDVPSAVAGKREAPGWSSLRAFGSGRVHALSSAVLRPGPRIGEGLKELARAVHGESILPR
ncbi:MAG: helical backbone metal receptor [Polyangiaceae bacterium]